MGLILWKQSAAQHIVTVYRTAIINNNCEETRILLQRYATPRPRFTFSSSEEGPAATYPHTIPFVNTRTILIVLLSGSECVSFRLLLSAKP